MKKTKKIASAIPIYCAAAVWLLMGLIAGSNMLKIGVILLGCALSAGAYIVGSRVFKGRTVEISAAANTGDAELNAYIDAGRKQLAELKAANDAIPDPDITKNLDRMITAGGKIFDTLEGNASQANAVRRFMNYYLPTAGKLMKTYTLLMETGGTGENSTHTMQSVRNSLGMIATAFEKQLDDLHRDKVLDIDTDIDVLKTMLTSDGLIDTTADGQDEGIKLTLGGY